MFGFANISNLPRFSPHRPAPARRTSLPGTCCSDDFLTSSEGKKCAPNSFPSFLTRSRSPHHLSLFPRRSHPVNPAPPQKFSPRLRARPRRRRCPTARPSPLRPQPSNVQHVLVPCRITAKGWAGQAQHGRGRRQGNGRRRVEQLLLRDKCFSVLCSGVLLIDWLGLEQPCRCWLSLRRVFSDRLKSRNIQHGTWYHSGEKRRTQIDKKGRTNAQTASQPCRPPTYTYKFEAAAPSTEPRQRKWARLRQQWSAPNHHVPSPPHPPVKPSLDR